MLLNRELLCGGGDCRSKPLTLIKGIRDSRQLVNVCISYGVVNIRCFLPPPADASINKGRKSRPLPARQPIQTTGWSGWRLGLSFFIQTQLALWYEQITFNCSKLYSCLRRIFVKMICAVKMILYLSCLCCVFFISFTLQYTQCFLVFSCSNKQNSTNSKSCLLQLQHRVPNVIFFECIS